MVIKFDGTKRPTIFYLSDTTVLIQVWNIYKFYDMYLGKCIQTPKNINEENDFSTRNLRLKWTLQKSGGSTSNT